MEEVLDDGKPNFVPPELSGENTQSTAAPESGPEPGETNPAGDQQGGAPELVAGLGDVTISAETLDEQPGAEGPLFSAAQLREIDDMIRDRLHAYHAELAKRGSIPPIEEPMQSLR